MCTVPACLEKRALVYLNLLVANWTLLSSWVLSLSALLTLITESTFILRFFANFSSVEYVARGFLFVIQLNYLVQERVFADWTQVDLHLLAFKWRSGVPRSWAGRGVSKDKVDEAVETAQAESYFGGDNFKLGYSGLLSHTAALTQKFRFKQSRPGWVPGCFVFFVKLLVTWITNTVSFEACEWLVVRLCQIVSQHLNINRKRLTQI